MYLNPIHILRALQALFAIIILGLDASGMSQMLGAGQKLMIRSGSMVQLVEPPHILSRIDRFPHLHRSFHHSSHHSIHCTCSEILRSAGEQICDA